MKQLFSGIVVLFVGIGLGIWRTYRNVQHLEEETYMEEELSSVMLIFPYLIVVGIILTFAGLVTRFVGRSQRKRKKR